MTRKMTDDELIRYLDIADQDGVHEYIRRLSPQRRELYERIALLHRNLRTGNYNDQQQHFNRPDRKEPDDRNDPS